MSFIILLQERQILLLECIDHSAPTSGRCDYLYLSREHAWVKDEPVGELSVGVVLWKNVKVRLVLVDAHPMISSRTKAWIRSPVWLYAASGLTTVGSK